VKINEAYSHNLTQVILTEDWKIKTQYFQLHVE